MQSEIHQKALAQLEKMNDEQEKLSSPYEKEFVEVFNDLAPATQQYLLLIAKELLNTQEKLLNTNSEKEDNFY